MTRSEHLKAALTETLKKNDCEVTDIQFESGAEEITIKIKVIIHESEKIWASELPTRREIEDAAQEIYRHEANKDD